MRLWPNGWVFLYELSGFGFESSCSHLNVFPYVAMWIPEYGAADDVAIEFENDDDNDENNEDEIDVSHISPHEFAR